MMKKIQRLAELREKAERDEASAMSFARNQGLQEGLKEGEARGEKSRNTKKVPNKNRLKLPKKCLKIK